MKDSGKKILVISLILLILISGILVLYNFYKGYKEDKIKTQEIIDNITNNYNDFIGDLNKFNNQREVLYTEIFKENYYSNMKDSIDNWNTIINTYSKLVKEIDTSSKFLKENCTNLEIYNFDIEEKCDKFNVNYEMIINSYISDINIYNDTINGYNTWIKEENNNYELVNEFVDKDYNKYIDFNNDGEFLGKE